MEKCVDPLLIAVQINGKIVIHYFSNVARANHVRSKKGKTFLCELKKTC